MSDSSLKTGVDLRLLREMAEGLRHNAAVFRDQNARGRERQLYDTASAICNAADELEQLRLAATASEKRAEHYRGLVLNLHKTLIEGWQYQPDADAIIAKGDPS